MKPQPQKKSLSERMKLAGNSSLIHTTARVIRVLSGIAVLVMSGLQIFVGAMFLNQERHFVASKTTIGQVYLCGYPIGIRAAYMLAFALGWFFLGVAVYLLWPRGRCTQNS